MYTKESMYTKDYFTPPMNTWEYLTVEIDFVLFLVLVMDYMEQTFHSVEK